ncbi:MAG: hypothetical protein QNK37_05875 [Acidobacteriota bacterium]|nr:hypothetical protein [Acidobacteriota bacterium]
MRNEIIRPFVERILKRLQYPQTPIVIDLVLQAIKAENDLREVYNRIVAENDHDTVNREIGRCVRELTDFTSTEKTQRTNVSFAKTFTLLIPKQKAEIDEGILAVYGDEFTQKQARKVLPILVRQAEAAQIIYYGVLAKEIGIPNHRNLNTILVAIGNALSALEKQWQEPVPPLQFLVVNKDTELPGEGVSPFSPDPVVFRKANQEKRRRIQDKILEKVYDYPKYSELLSFFGLERNRIEWREKKELCGDHYKYGSGGEGPQHQALKNHIAQNPGSVGLTTKKPGIIEYGFPSQDAIDVMFCNGKNWTGVEVKPYTSDDADLERGLFQCIKYRALAEAVCKAKGCRRDIEVILAVGRAFPQSLMPLKNILGVKVVDNIRTPETQSRK